MVEEEDEAELEVEEVELEQEGAAPPLSQVGAEKRHQMQETQMPSLPVSATAASEASAQS